MVHLKQVKFKNLSSIFLLVRAARVGNAELLPAALCPDLSTDPGIFMPCVIQAHCGWRWLMGGKTLQGSTALARVCLRSLLPPWEPSPCFLWPRGTAEPVPFPLRGHSAWHQQECTQTTRRHKPAAPGCVQPNQDVVCAVSLRLCTCLLLPSNQRESLFSTTAPRRLSVHSCC